MGLQAKAKQDSREKTVMAAHCSHCGGTCLLKVHVKDGVITRIETDDGAEPQYRGCARGRAYRQRVYAPDRILYPMKRVGARGEGKFERISWDEALDKVAGELTRVKKTYGPQAILFKSSGGDQGRINRAFAHRRLLSMAGGYSVAWAIHSWEGAIFAQVATFGTTDTGNTRDDLLNSKLILMWGWNPTDTIMLTNTSWYMAKAREAGIRIISIDPKYTNTAALFADKWIPIRPGTDAAVMVAMAYVMIKEGLHDREFLDTYTVGFDKFQGYILGDDGQPKTPQWAEAISGIPAATIESLAREYATMKPAALLAGISAGRTAYGEQFHRVSATLAAMTGNIGINGGDAGVASYTGSAQYRFLKLGKGMEVPPNPVDSMFPPRKVSFAKWGWGGYTQLREGQVHIGDVGDAILKGKAGGYPADFKLLYVVNNNFPNQYLNLNKSVQALKSDKLEFVVVLDQFMTPAARFADVILPVNTCMERNDIAVGANVGYYGFMGQAIESQGESKSHLEICCALAERLGIKGYSDKTEDEWLKQIATGNPEITDYAAFKQAGGYKIKPKEPYVAMKQFIADPKKNPFPTPSGKIEIYSQRLADMDEPKVPAIPKYMETWESRNDPLAQKYPLQLITTHFWRRAHSQYDNIPWLRELEAQRIWLNADDARARGIKDGDMVRAFNDRGVTVLPAKVTHRIMPGVVDIPQGAWYAPDKNGVDRGGNGNVLTRDQPSPGGAWPSNTALVQVVKE